MSQFELISECISLLLLIYIKAITSPLMSFSFDPELQFAPFEVCFNESSGD